jgi:hypothetical protein
MHTSSRQDAEAVKYCRSLMSDTPSNYNKDTLVGSPTPLCNQSIHTSSTIAKFHTCSITLVLSAMWYVHNNSGSNSKGEIYFHTCCLQYNLGWSRYMHS